MSCAETDAKTLPGISQPFPEIFDPANLLSNATSIQEVRRWRYVTTGLAFDCCEEGVDAPITSSDIKKCMIPRLRKKFVGIFLYATAPISLSSDSSRGVHS